MTVDWRSSTWKQFGAAIDMLGDAINLVCGAKLVIEGKKPV
jgi:hypothetical protein